MSNLVDINGREVSSAPKIYNTFFEWKQNSLDVTSLAAWNHQELKLKNMREGFAEAVCHGKEGLRAQIEEKNKTIEELKKFCEENLKIMAELEIKLVEAQGKLNG